MNKDRRNLQVNNVPAAEVDMSLVEGVTQQLLRRLIVGQTIAVFVLLVMTLGGGLLFSQSGLVALAPLAGIAVTIGLVSYNLLQRGRQKLASYIFLFGTAIAITVNVYVRGYADASALYYLWPILGAVLLMGSRGSLSVALFSALLYLALVIVQNLGYLPPPIPYDARGEILLTVGSRLIMFFLLAFLGWLFRQNLQRVLGQAQHAALRLQDLNETLEQQIIDRTRELAQRNRYLESTARVARDVSWMLGDFRQLLTHVVNLISDQFGFYHAGIFLLDATGEWAILQAASSTGGQRMLTRGHRLGVGQQGTVGYVTATGEPRIALDVGTDAIFFDNPDLPETHSALTLPLKIRDEIIGALDVQSKAAGAFTEEDAEILQILADQVAVAISNARLAQQVRESAAAEQRARGEVAREAWRELLRANPDLGFLSDVRGTVPAGDVWDMEMRAALQGAPVSGEQGIALAVPIRSRGQVIGVIDAHLPEDVGEWTPEQISLLEALSQQVGTALESAQLYRESQRRAIRERLNREITDRMRGTLSWDELLQVAIEEMADAVQAQRAFVQWTALDQEPARPEEE